MASFVGEFKSVSIIAEKEAFVSSSYRALEESKTNNEAAIRELTGRFANAFRAKDVNGIMSVFAPEIVSFDILPLLQAVGADTFVKHCQEFFVAAG
jgi:ketosteroid isomerase-like protein